VHILKEIVEAYHARSVKVYFVRLREQPMDLFEKSGLYNMIGKDYIFGRVPEAIEAIEKDMVQQ
jgi:MFS superfamily sulfate permease-like transporter